MTAAQEIQAEIAELKQKGFKDSDIAEYYTQEMTAAKIPQKDQDSFLGDFGMNPVKVATPTPIVAPAKPELSLGKQFLESTLESLPTAGATFGSVLGPLGAGLGGGAGKALENTVRAATGLGGVPTASEALLGPFKEGMNMASWEMGGNLLGAGVGKALDYAKSNAPKILDFAKQEGLKLSPSTLNPESTWAKVKDAVVNLFPTGKAMTKYYQNKTYRWMMDSRGKFLEEATGVPLGEGGFTRGAGEAATSARVAGSKAYQDVITSAGGATQDIPMTNLKQWFDGIYDEAPVKLQQLIKDFRTRVGKGETMTAKDLDEFMGKAAKNKEFKTQIEEQLFSDLQAFDESMGTKVRDAAASAAGKFKQSKNYEFMNNLFTKFTAERGGEEYFQTGNFYRTVMNPKTQKYIKDNLGNVILTNLKDYAERMLVLGREVEKRGSGDQAVRGVMTAAMGGAYWNPSLLIPYGLAPAAAWFIMKPRSSFIKWLAESHPLKEALKVGGRAAISGGTTGEW